MQSISWLGCGRMAGITGISDQADLVRQHRQALSRRPTGVLLLGLTIDALGLESTSRREPRRWDGMAGVSNRLDAIIACRFAGCPNTLGTRPAPNAW